MLSFLSLLTLSLLSASPISTDGTGTKIDLFGEDQSATLVKNHRVNWPACGMFPNLGPPFCARPHVDNPLTPLSIKAGEGDYTIDLGDIHWFGQELSTDITRIAIRVDGKDNLVLCGDDNTEVCLSDDSGFTVFDTDISSLKIEGLTEKPTGVEVAIFWMNTHAPSEPAPHRMENCTNEFSIATEDFHCGWSRGKLMEYRVYVVGGNTPLVFPN